MSEHIRQWVVEIAWLWGLSHRQFSVYVLIRVNTGCSQKQHIGIHRTSSTVVLMNILEINNSNKGTPRIAVLRTYVLQLRLYNLQKISCASNFSFPLKLSLLGVSASDHCSRNLLKQTNIHNMPFLPPAHHHTGHLQTGQTVLPSVHQLVYGWVSFHVYFEDNS